jgi:hypothetical protein
MTNTKEQIARHLSVLVGLDISGVNHAADMLTLQFGPLRQMVNRKGTVKQVGTWALHVQCRWQIERAGEILATQFDLRGSDDDANRAVGRIYDLLVTSGPTHVENVLANESGGVCLSLSIGLRIAVTPGRVTEEDWRLFSPGSDAKHFVIEGGTVAVE